MALVLSQKKKTFVESFFLSGRSALFGVPCPWRELEPQTGILLLVASSQYPVVLNVGILLPPPERTALRKKLVPGASQCKSAAGLFLAGRVRRSDWLPVGCDPRGNEQLKPGVLSESDSEEDGDSYWSSFDSEDEGGVLHARGSVVGNDFEDELGWAIDEFKNDASDASVEVSGLFD